MVHTDFAPAERAEPNEVERQFKMLSELPFVHEFLDSMPNMTLVLNKERQIVFANRTFCDFIGIGDNMEKLIASRPGEAIGCIRSATTEGGCGTTLFCQNCGAVLSIMNSQQKNALDVQECRMQCGEEADSIDLRVWSRPIEIKGERFTVFSVVDISNEKRRKVLERIFFHDVLNTAGGIKGLADLMANNNFSESKLQEFAGLLSESAEHLVDEIDAQRMLTAAEDGDLRIVPIELNSADLISRTIHHFQSMPCAENKVLSVCQKAETFSFKSDPVLIYRVLINLTKNALEAIEPEAKVTLCCHSDNEHIYFSVHNATVIPSEIQRQLFVRSFSTKGSGRGLGTYSIKLITERYLHGSVSFASNPEQGTLFTVCYPR